MTHRSSTAPVLIVAMVVIPLLGFPLPGHSQNTEEGKAFRTSGALLDAFKDPPASYRSVPFWVWNDRITPEIIDEGLADLRKHGIGGVFIHARIGLITPYLSGDWLSLWRHAVQTGKKLGMKIWLYDENAYPSGFAGGFVPEKMPDAKRTGLKMISATELPSEFTSEPLLVLAKDSTGFTDITSLVKTRPFGAGDYRIVARIYDQPSARFGGFTYVDLMRPDVTREFIDVTLNAYNRVIGDEFGNVVPGVFQDEAEVRPPNEKGARVVGYTPGLFDTFAREWGYDLKTSLVSLFDETGDWRKVRHDSYATILKLFIDGWAKQYFDYCTANGLKLTGHYWEHTWPKPVNNPDNMACAAYAHMPGIDVLMNEFKTDVEAQFGNARIVKEIRSVANQLGYERTLSETFGASGWDLTFKDQKRIADWEYALGVNFLNQHLTYATIKGARKRDHPPSFSYHEPWWRFYRPLADYFGRLSVALCAGEQMNRILVLEPTTTAWMYASPEWKNSTVDSLGKTFQEFVNALEAAQIEYDLGSEDILCNHGSVKNRSLVVGKRAYDLIVLPQGTENLEGSSVALLAQYLANGGTLLCCGGTPAFVDGKPSDRLATLAAQHRENWIRPVAAGALEAINRLSPPVLLFRDTSGLPSSFPLLYHHRRVLEDSELLFLANTRLEYCSGEILASGRSCDRWDLFTGATARYPSVLEGERITIRFSLPPGGSLLLCLRPVAQSSPAMRSETWADLPPHGKTVVHRVEPNVLTLDYCDLTLGGKTERDLYFYEAQQKTFQHHGLDRNPWDNAVQFKTNIVDRDTFSRESGFDATFHCTLAGGAKTTSLRAVVERPELFRIAVNGKTVKPLPGKWWLDKAFGLFDIGKFLKEGDNSVSVTSSPFTIHSELEPIYLLGNFSLESGDKGFRILPAEPIRLGAWNEQGMPFYAGGVGYTRAFELGGSQITSSRFLVRLGRWSGVVAGVTVNGREAGTIAFAPYELDVTEAMKPGTNRITVTVYGSLKNTLGPHHNNPPLGRAWPGQFQQGAKEGRPAGSMYSTVGYGLLEDFVLTSTLR